MKPAIQALTFAAVALLVHCADAQQSPALCTLDGNPIPRPPDLTYGGLPDKPGWVRDHKWPHCAGGPDTAANVQYQLPGPSFRKDAIERAMCKAMCRDGYPTPAAIQKFFQESWP
jgi:hypothetical protein